MIQLARRASLLAAFSLDRLGCDAYAECAWGLWENYPTPHPYTSDLVVPHSRPIQSFAKLDDCNLLHADVTSKVAKEYKGPGSYAYVRLPDTVDPRGPKAGER
jgi:hypothetical protein